MKTKYQRLLKSSAKKIIYTMHALDEMNKPDEIIAAEDVRYAIMNGQIIEDYPFDKRGHSFLICVRLKNNKVIHVVCAPKQEYLAIITVYIPSSQKWEADFTKRRKK